jgi:ATP-dependent DNA ligase
VTGLLDTLENEERALVKRSRAAFVAPMLSTLTPERFTDPAWIFERKLDGVRAVAVRDEAGASLWSRAEKPMDAAYPELVDAVTAQVPPGTVLDGEIVAFDGPQTSFQRLQGRIGLHDPDAARDSGIPVFLYVFDLLVVDG